MIWLIIVPVFIGVTFAAFSLLAEWVSTHLLRLRDSMVRPLVIVTLYIAFVIPGLVIALRALGIKISW